MLLTVCVRPGIYFYRDLLVFFSIAFDSVEGQWVGGGGGNRFVLQNLEHWPNLYNGRGDQVP